MKFLILSKGIFCFLFLAPIALKSTNSFAANVNATATAVIIQALSIAKNNDLNLGTGARGDAAKIVAPADSTAAVFTVTGQPNTAYTITLQPSINMTRTGGTETLAVTAFTSSPATTGTLSATGTQTLRVGATRAAIPVGQVLGTYTGTFTVTVNY